MTVHRVVIIGSGFGGLNAAKALKRADVEITLISKTTTHLFQPLLYQVATGILSEGDIAATTRLILRKQQNVRVLLGEVSAIDLKANTVTSNGSVPCWSADSLSASTGRPPNGGPLYAAAAGPTPTKRTAAPLSKCSSRSR